MEKMWIYIPTYGRANKQITFSKIPKKWQEQTIFVVRPEEASLFNWHCNPPLICDKIGVPAARQRALEHCPTNKIWFFDDDLNFSYRPEEWSLEFPYLKQMSFEILNEALQIMEEKLDNFAIVGMDERAMNNGKPQRYYKNAGRIMRAFGIRKDILEAENLRFDKYLFWEDFHIALSLFKKGYMGYLSLVYLNNGTTNTKGGVSSYRKFEILRSVRTEFLQEHAPFAVPVNKQIKTWNVDWEFIPDLRIYWKKALESAR